MREKNSASRRTFMKTIGTIVAGSTVLTASGIAQEGHSIDDEPLANSQEEQLAADDQILNDRFLNDRVQQQPSAGTTGAYVATVDRIVDGSFVVLLIEENNQVIDQVVVERSELSSVEESDVLLVTLVDGELVAARQLDEKTDRRFRRIRDLFDRLSGRVSETS